MNAASQSAPLAEVAGRVAFITGGSSGIGLGLAQACVNAGMHVAITYRSGEHRDAALDQLAGAEARAFELDVTDRVAFARVADEVEQSLGHVHLLACNAGIGIRAGAAEASFADWDWGLGVNLGGVINAVATFLPRLRAHGEGAQVLATASTSGLAAGGGVGVYATAKFGVVGLIESLREELAGTNIGASVFCPGFVRTNLVETEKRRPAEFANAQPKPSTTAPTGAEEAALRKFAGLAMDPLEAGRLALEGVRRNDLHILTHAEFAPVVRERMEALLAAFPAEAAPRSRAMAAQRFLTPIYSSERDRRKP